MTKQRFDNHSTEFGLWLRSQHDIDSKLGFATTNIDYLWKNTKTGNWMLIEEKRYMAKPSWSQKELFKVIHKSCLSSKKYHGIHLIQFEKTSPEDGKVYLNGKLITNSELINFLQFKEAP